jgi:hypothetical protein
MVPAGWQCARGALLIDSCRVSGTLWCYSLGRAPLAFDGGGCSASPTNLGKELTSPGLTGRVSVMPSFPFSVTTHANKEANTVKLILGDRSHGTFKSLEELLRYAARIKTGRVVLMPGAVSDKQSLRIVCDNIKMQVRKLREQGFK